MTTSASITAEQIQTMWPHLDTAKANLAVGYYAASKTLTDALREHPNPDIRDGLLRQVSQVITSAVQTL